jgi:thiol-disulfide isomerase/thioredoxin
VVLVDFWTYTCVNWLRTLPYLRAWHAKYADRGLTIVGVHTPEFGFERTVENIVEQARDLGVSYPIAVDSDHRVWQAFANHYWPAAYLADAEGRIRFHHFGEGEYAMTEMVIQRLLQDAGAVQLDEDLVDVAPSGLELAADWRTLGSPETYLGSRQAVGFASADIATYDAPQRYDRSAILALNQWDLTGTWTVAGHAAVLVEPPGRIAFRFHARDVNLVMGPAVRGGSLRFQVLLDGRPAGGAAGVDLGADARGTVTAQRTYQLLRQTGPIVDRLIEIEFHDAGVEAYCFTFG